MAMLLRLCFLLRIVVFVASTLALISFAAAHEEPGLADDDEHSQPRAVCSQKKLAALQAVEEQLLLELKRGEARRLQLLDDENSLASVVSLSGHIRFSFVAAWHDLLVWLRGDLSLVLFYFTLGAVAMELLVRLLHICIDDEGKTDLDHLDWGSFEQELRRSETVAAETAASSSDSNHDNGGKNQRRGKHRGGSVDDDPLLAYFANQVYLGFSLRTRVLLAIRASAIGTCAFIIVWFMCLRDRVLLRGLRQIYDFNVGDDDGTLFCLNNNDSSWIRNSSLRLSDVHVVDFGIFADYFLRLPRQMIEMIAVLAAILVLVSFTFSLVRRINTRLSEAEQELVDAERHVAKMLTCVENCR